MTQHRNRFFNIIPSENIKFISLLQMISLIAFLFPLLQTCVSISSTPTASLPNPIVKTLTPTPIRIHLRNLPQPFATQSVSKGAQYISQPSGATLNVPKNFTIKRFAQGLSKPRWMTIAPNGDLFLAESYDNRIRLLRDTNKDGIADDNILFADGLNQPFGMAIAPDQKSFYIANTDAVVRYPYQVGQTKLQGQPTIITRLTGGGYNQHWTRNLIFSPDGSKLYVSVGSRSNADPEEAPRATLQVMNPDGSNRQTFASGLRNPVGLAFHPITRTLYTTVNERDGLGDDLVPDYLTSVKAGSFYGWPYTYLGNHPDPRLPRRPDLMGSTTVPDILFQAHSAALGLVFYHGKQFPTAYRNDAYVAFRGSWNRSQGTGYKIVRVPFTPQGKPKGYYEDFVTGWLTDPTGPTAWGRPVGLAIAQDGALLITDEPGGVIWRVSYSI